MTMFQTKVAAANSPRWVHLLVAIVPVMLAAPAGAQLAEALAGQVQADQESAKTQNEINTIRDRTRDAGVRRDQATADADNLDRYNNQLQEQVKTQQTEIASIDRQLTEIETTNREVQPLMQQMVDTLAQFVDLDVPFMLDERKGRVQGLKDMMSRADVTISEKYRRILEAYQIELEYGRTLSAYQGRLGTGADARTVEFVQLGRVALMYRTSDGSETGYYDASKKSWVPDASYRQAVEVAIKVAKHDGPAELLTVPVPAPQEVRS